MQIKHALLLLFSPLLFANCNEEENLCKMEVKIRDSVIIPVTLLQVDVIAGLAPFTYSWSPGNSTDSFKILGSNDNEFYTLTVTDALGCTATTSFDNKCKGLSVKINKKDLGGDLIELTGEGDFGNTPYKWYKWSTGEFQKVITVTYGTYSVTVTDALDCERSTSITVEKPVLVGSSGNPRINLQYTIHERVDLDLYVKTPYGNLIYFSSDTADGGKLDIDCYCVSCPFGPSENIFWVPGTAPKGLYTYWVKYYNSCDGSNDRSTYTIRRMNEFGVVEETLSGTLGSGESSPENSFTLQ